jgi:DNA-binding NtrC family response regulator
MSADKLIELAAGSNRSVLIWHDDPVERQSIAAAIHERSGRSAGPFVCLLCSSATTSSSSDRIEEELLGYEQGALLGRPEARPGVLEMANGGTVFIDDIARLSLATQWSVLLALESGSTTRLGGILETKVDVRFICGTGVDLRPLVKARQFRMDLFSTLSLLAICVPPTRDLSLEEWPEPR